MKKIKAFLIAGMMLFFMGSYAQPFANEIADFEKQDARHGVYFEGRKPIVFAGSSSFRMWTKVNEAFPSYPIINRGFGGSSLPDVIRYANETIFKYKPKQVVIYCGENDLAAADSVTGRMVFDRFVTLFNMIRANDKKTSVVFVSIKPSPSRMSIQAQAKIANEMIRNFLAKKKRTGYVDVYTPMLNADGSMKEELFLGDRLHMKPAGYDIWQKAIYPYLLK